MAPRKPESAQVAKDHAKPDNYRVKKARPSTKNSQIKLTKNDNGLLKAEPKGKLQELAKKNSETSPFLRLPLELRMRIYGYALGGNDYRIYRPKRKPICTIEGMPQRQFRRSLQVQSVCTQIYSETATLPFSQNSFCILPHQLHTWLDTLIPGHRDAIKTVKVNFPEAKGGISDLRRLKGLKQVHVCYTPDSRSGLANIAKNLRRGAGNPRLRIVFRRFG